MSFILILKIIVAILSLVFGIVGIFRPKAMADFAHFGISDARGLAETRINFGGFFIALGGGAIILNDAGAWMLLGMGYAGLAIVRLISGVLHRNLFKRDYNFTLIFEGISAIILFFPIS